MGRVRTTPDVGAYEAIDASVSGRVYVDLNQNQIHDPDEPLVNDVVLRANATAIDVTNLTGAFSFERLSTRSDNHSRRCSEFLPRSKASLQIVPPLAASNTSGSTTAASYRWKIHYL